VCLCVSAVERVLVCMHYAVIFREICGLRLIKTNFCLITIVNSEVPGRYIVLLQFRTDEG